MISASRPPAQLVFSLLLLAACTQTHNELRVYDHEAVLNGQVSGPQDDAIVKIEALAASGTQWTCSGTLVAPNLVITARHCITNFVDGFWTCDVDGTLRSSSGAGQMGLLDTPSNITIRSGTGPNPPRVAKGTAIFAPQADSICVNDIALVQLDHSLTNPVKPIRIYTGTNPGEEIRVIGYGTDQDGGIGVRHTRSGLVIAQVGSSVFRPVGDPTPPRTFVTKGPALCIGDSGGPALSDNEAIIGIFSQYDGLCTSPSATNIFTEVAPFANDVILPAFAAAGYEPWLEGNSEPGLYGTGGASGTGGANGTGGAANTGGETSAQSETGGSSSSDTSLGGAPIGTGGDTSGPAVYDQAPPSGGSCACRMARNRRAGLSALLAMAMLLGLKRRRFSTSATEG